MSRERFDAEVWCETSTPDLEEGKAFAGTIAKFQRELGAMGYRFQFITLAGWHLINLETFKLASAYAAEGMPAYVRLQDEEFALEESGYTATRHQREVGTGYFDQVLQTLSGGTASTGALAGDTEAEQF